MVDRRRDSPAERDVVDPFRLPAGRRNPNPRNRFVGAHAPERAPVSAGRRGGADETVLPEDVDLTDVIAEVGDEVHPRRGDVPACELDDESVGEVTGDDCFRHRAAEAGPYQRYLESTGRKFGVESHARLDLPWVEAVIVARRV